MKIMITLTEAAELSGLKVFSLRQKFLNGELIGCRVAGPRSEILLNKSKLLKYLGEDDEGGTE